jgi:ubiquinone biosynthesis protein
VIVKIQRPEIESQVESDLEILIALAGIAEGRSPLAKQVGLLGMIEDYAKLFRRELDYDREAKNTERMRLNFAGDQQVIIPQVIWELTTPRVLTEEYIEGVKFSNLEEVDRRGWDRRRVSTLATEAFLSQIVEHGFFQVDPHPGNLLIVDEEHIAFIDFGEVAVLTGRRLESMGGLITSMGAREMDGVMVALRELGIITDSVNSDDLQEDLADLIERVFLGNIANLDIRRLQKDILDLAFRYQLRLPSYLTSLMKALITVEGVGRKLDPGFDFTEVVKELAEKVLQERFKPKSIVQMAKRSYYRDLRPLAALPREFGELIRTTGQGRLTMQVQLGFNQEARGKLTQLTNRLSASLIITGGLVGSALALRSGSPLLHDGYNVFGIVLLGVSLVGILGLLFSLRSRR